MHLIGSTILALILSPVNWILLLIIILFIVKKPERKKFCGISAIVIFFVFGNPVLLNEYAKWWQPGPRDVSKDSTYSCGILLGGFGSPDTDESGYFNTSADRFIQAAKLYKTGRIEHILINGGNGKSEKKGFNEAAWAKGEFRAMGIPDSAIIYEDRSKNTADNVVFAKKILDSFHLKPPYLLITSAHHIPRASLLFKYAGVHVVGFPCNYTSGKESYNFMSILPRPDILLSWDKYMKETAGYIIYLIKKK